MRIGPLGIWELLIILVVVLLIFGPRRLPEMAKGIGQSVREFRKGIRDMKDDFEAGSKDDQPASRKPATSASERSAAAPAGEPAENKPASDEPADAKAEAKPVDTKSA
jgi:sec-independent protein translocase protein TatA